MEQIAPVLVLSTGRCGSTMTSDVLNLHPEVLSLSEVFSLLGPLALFRKRLSGKAMWALCSRQNPALRVLLSGGTIPSEFLYPFDDPHVRYTTRNVPPILCTMLPHLTPNCENLYDDLESTVRARPRTALGDQYHFLFEWLREHFGRRVWVELSGGSLLSVPKLLAGWKIKGLPTRHSGKSFRFRPVYRRSAPSAASAIAANGAG